MGGERDKSLPASSIERISADVASALDYLHTEKHILHGDIKSGNVLVVGDCETAKLCDFGVTVPLDSEGKCIAGKVYVGTEAWSPKEVIMGDSVITSKADMFALFVWMTPVTQCTAWQMILASRPLLFSEK